MNCVGLVIPTWSSSKDGDSSDEGAKTCTFRQPVFFLCRRGGSLELILTRRRSLERGLLSLRLRLRRMSVGSSFSLSSEIADLEVHIGRSSSRS